MGSDDGQTTVSRRRYHVSVQVTVSENVWVTAESEDEAAYAAREQVLSMDFWGASEVHIMEVSGDA